jgi:hypothetical protein
MMIRRLLNHTTDKAGLRATKPVRHHALLITTLAVGAGIVSALVAASAGEPFTSLREHPQTIDLTSRLVHAALPATPIEASTLFPPSPGVQKVVDMYDLPPVVAQQPEGNGGGDDGHGDDGGHGGDD